jgi:glycosyltransferase involved in cell wall biosynthesis
VKVAFVLGTTSGGTGRHVRMLASGCVERGVAVTVFGPAETERAFAFGEIAVGSARDTGDAGGGWDGPSRPPAPPGFVPVDIADRPRPVRDAAAVLRLRRLLARSGADVVHAHGLRAGAIAALALAVPSAAVLPPALPPPPVPSSGARSLTARHGRPALLVTVHNAPVAGGVTGAVYGVLERIVARRAAEVLCVSGDLAERMRRLGARAAGLAVVPAPPPADSTPGEGGRGDGAPAAGGSADGAASASVAAVAAVRAELGATGTAGAADPPVVLSVGRFAAQKGFGTLLDAASRWRGREPVPLLIIAGEGPLLGELSRQASERRLAVRFLGQREDVPALLAAADVVVVPSRWEGQPLIVQETLRAGRPLVATAVGGIPDLTGQDGAVLVPPDDPERLAAAVCSVLDDPGLARRLAEAALARASSLPSESDAVDAALARYRRLAGGQG